MCHKAAMCTCGVTSGVCAHPTVPVRCCWQAVLTLVWKSSFVWTAASFLKHYKRGGGRFSEVVLGLTDRTTLLVNVLPEGAVRWFGPFGRAEERSWLKLGRTSSLQVNKSEGHVTRWARERDKEHHHLSVILNCISMLVLKVQYMSFCVFIIRPVSYFSFC